MSQPWNSLYFRCDDAATLTQTLRDLLTAVGYELYNPFSLIPGKAYKRTVRLFVAPPGGGWIRIIGEPDETLLPPLSRLGLCLYAALDAEGAATITVHASGQAVPPETALLSQLRPNITADDLQRALKVNGPGSNQPPPAKTADLPLTVLPPDVQAMAGQVNPAQAQKMFNRLSGQLLKRAGGGDDAAAAQALLTGDAVPDWNSPGGRQIRALMACLTIPDNWREPDFTALRDAYQLHERRRLNPNARLYPGDADAMAQVPDALTYQVVYGGRS